jgi:hypothetical protein
VDAVDSLLESVRRHIADQGGELEGMEELRTALRGGGSPGPCPAPVVLEEPPAREWLPPDDADVKYSDVWIAQTASGSVVLAHVKSHRRRDRYNKRAALRWYGVDVLTGREVRIARVLVGSCR